MRIGIFTVIKNEMEYLDEWLDYHLKLGFDKIYVVEDKNSDSHKDICSKYESVALMNISEMLAERPVNGNVPRQTKYIISCLSYIKEHDSLDWVAYIDIDEFITLENENESIKDIMSLFSDYNMVSLQWKNYNASGNIFKPSGSVLSNYTKECALYAGRNMCSFASSKLFFNMNLYKVKRMRFNHHIPFDKDGWCKTNFSNNLCEAVYNKIYIRHYITKSFEEFCHKIFERGQFNNSKDLRTFFLFNPDISDKDETVKSIVDSYYERFMSGDLRYHL